ncbi:MAG TPA: pyrimidine dimer DNA glycosylase/endonuclease V [Verrucomicrobiae bacterium]|jgi:hypothetical protein|nr:pyrimidine dimer DNA glycosylase/endonuclease V [Verrucomicrobiae bacterium]
MRLWTIHPKHLDAKGLVALWREGLLAQKVLQGRTRGYQHHPQLLRFQVTRNPVGAIASYLKAVHEESVRRGYHFDRSKIDAAGLRRGHKITETKEQLLYEWKHLKAKLAVRDTARYRASRSIVMPEHHPLFRLVEGEVRDWERRPPEAGKNRR